LTSADHTPAGPAPEDAGLLAPGRAGSPVEAATGDAAFCRAMLDAEAALARAQAALGLVPAEAARAVDDAARAARPDVRSLALRARATGNPVPPLVADLAALAGPAGADAVHRGATSQDIVDTAAMLVAREARRLITADLDRVAAHLAALAAAHRDTPLPGRTLTQHAVPTTFGLKAAGWLTAVAHARDRLAGLPLPAQLGGAAGTLAAPAGPAGDAAAAALRLPAVFAAEAGLAEPLLPWHTLRAPVAELGAALALVCGALGKIAADVLVLSRTEIGEVAESGGGGSSAMPHKSNPVRATLIAAAARQAPAAAAVLLGCVAAEDERPAGAWHAEWAPLRDLLRLTGGAARDAAELTGGLRVFPDRMRANLDLTGGAVVSERVAAALAPALGRAAARDLVTAAARDARERGVALIRALRDAGPPLTDAQWAALLPLTDPAAYTGVAAALTDRALRAAARPGEDR
jgi:3-carboxy-cis,cis-muconate cycloisomerase